MKAEILSLLVTFVHEFENYRRIFNRLLKLDALMFWKMPVFRKSVVETQISQEMIPPKKNT